MKCLRYLSTCLLIILPFCAAIAQLPEGATQSFGDRLIMGVLKDHPFELNPFRIRSPAEKEIVHMIFGSGLTKRSDKFGNPPELIDRYFTRSSRHNSRVWRMLLKRNINFQNGDILRNVDVKFTFEVLKKYGGMYLNREVDLGNIKSIGGSGDLELTFELFRPDDQFGLKLAGIPIISRRYYQEVLTRGYEVFSRTRPMGMGPFRVEQQSEDQLILSYNPHYFSGRPFLDGVVIRFYADEQALINAFVNGEVDYLELPDRTTALRLSNLMGSRAVFFRIPRPEVKLYAVLFNVTQFPFSEPEVRRAISVAVNRAGIVDRYMKEYGRPARTLLKDTSPYYDRYLFKEKYNPNAALRILRNAGWRLNPQTGLWEKNGRPLSFTLYFARNSFLEEGIARAIKIDLGELNINVKPVPVAPDAKSALLQRTEYQAMIHAYIYDPQYLLGAFRQYFYKVLGAGQVVPNYRNNYLHRLFTLVERGQAPRENVYHRFQQFIYREKPALFLFFDEQIIIGIDRRFRGYRLMFRSNGHTFYRLSPIENWYVPRELQKY